MKIYFYKLTADNGGAPCVRHDMLSLAICKPMIRSMAQRGDLLFGFAANSLHPDNRLVYVAVVSDKLSGCDYYGDARFEERGDWIYRLRGGKFYRRHHAMYHHGPEHLPHDLGEHPTYERANVLLSTDFRYFGKDGSANYKEQFLLIKQAVECLGRGHRVRHEGGLREQFLALKKQLWNRTRQEDMGKPSSTPSGSVSLRSRSCRVLAAPQKQGD